MIEDLMIHAADVYPQEASADLSRGVVTDMTVPKALGISCRYQDGGSMQADQFGQKTLIGDATIQTTYADVINGDVFANVKSGTQELFPGAVGVGQTFRVIGGQKYFGQGTVPDWYEWIVETVGFS